MKTITLLSAMATFLILSACGKEVTTDATATAPMPTPTVTVTAVPAAIQNIVCNVYDLSKNGLGNGNVPDTETLTPVASIVLGSINAPSEPVSDQFQLFPASLAAQLTGAYGLDCDSNLVTPVAGNYVLDLASDDGSQLFIDGTLQINNNGSHGMQAYTKTITLTAGEHKIRVLASQNGQGSQGLQLAWEVPGDTFYSIIPATSFSQQ